MTHEEKQAAERAIDDYLLELKMNGSFWVVATRQGAVRSDGDLEVALDPLLREVSIDGVLLRFVSNEVWL